MKATIGVIGLAVLFIHACQSKAREPQSQSPKLLIEATVEKIGPAPGVGSGHLAVYQFAKYRVISVCEGEYNRPEVVVDHLILKGDELDSFRPGDKVRVVIEKSNTIFMRNNEEGFRDPADNVEIFYLGEKPKLVPSNCAPCEPCS